MKRILPSLPGGRCRGAAPLLGFLLALVPAATARADFELTRWRYSRPIQAPRIGEGVIRFRIDGAIYDKSLPDLADLRIVDRGNREVAFATRKEGGPASPGVWSSTPFRFYNRTYRPGRSVSGTLDFGRKEMKTSLVLSMPGENFRREVKVEGSDDGIRWEVLRESAFLFDVREVPGGKPFRKEEVSFPPTDLRYMKVTIFHGPKDPRRLELPEEVHWAKEDATPPTLEPVSLKILTRTEDEEGHVTELELDGGARNRPLHALRFEFEDPNFHRHVEVSGRNGEMEEVSVRSENGAPRRVARRSPWRALSAGDLYRISAGAAGESGLVIPLSDAGCRFLRVRIYNGDDPPLSLRGVRAEAVTRSVVFPAAVGASYTLYYGNFRARRPSYDLTHFLPRLEQVRITDATLGDVEENPVYGDGPREGAWSERHPVILWGALLAAVGVLAYLIRTMASSTKAEV